MQINKLSLGQLVLYKITVPGKLEKRFLDWNGGLEITINTTEVENPTTTISIEVDQAGLHGFLRYLYSLGLPILSVNCIEV